jgi:hypothetical protein
MGATMLGGYAAFLLSVAPTSTFLATKANSESRKRSLADPLIQKGRPKGGQLPSELVQNFCRIERLVVGPKGRTAMVQEICVRQVTDSAWAFFWQNRRFRPRISREDWGRGFCVLVCCEYGRGGGIWVSEPG